MKTSAIVYGVYAVVLWFMLYFSTAYNIRHNPKDYANQEDVTKTVLAISLIALFWPLMVLIGVLVVVYKLVATYFKMLGRIITPKYLKEQFMLDKRDEEADKDPEFAAKHERLRDELSEEIDTWNDTSGYFLPDTLDD